MKVAGIAIALLLAALAASGWLLRSAYEANGKLETEKAVLAEAVQGLQREAVQLRAWHSALGELSVQMQAVISANAESTRTILRGVEHVRAEDAASQELLDRRLTDSLVGVLCDGDYFDPAIRADVCGHAAAGGEAGELPQGVPAGRDRGPSADVGHP